MALNVVSVADALAAALRVRLLSGELAGGTELRDTELAAEFGVARPTVRAAVQELVAAGLLDRGRGHSARVRAFTAADAVDLYCARRPIECEAVRIVLEESRGLEPVAAAMHVFHGLGPEVAWGAVADADIAFHRAVVGAAGSPRLLRLFDALGSEMRLLMAQLRSAYPRALDLVQEHAILDGVLRCGDLEQAMAAWREHFDAGEAFFVDTMKERGT